MRTKNLILPAILFTFIALPAWAGDPEPHPVVQALSQPAARVGAVISGPGKTMTSAGGHVDAILLDSDGAPAIDSRVIGFGPESTNIQDFLKMKGIPFIDWNVKFEDVLSEIEKGNREFIEVVVLRLPEEDPKQKFIDKLKELHEAIGPAAKSRVLYGTLNQNCATLVSRAVEATKTETAAASEPAARPDTKTRDVSRDRPLLFKEWLIKNGHHFDLYRYDKDHLKEPLHEEH